MVRVIRPDKYIGQLDIGIDHLGGCIGLVDAWSDYLDRYIDHANVCIDLLDACIDHANVCMDHHDVGIDHLVCTPHVCIDLLDVCVRHVALSCCRCVDMEPEPLLHQLCCRYSCCSECSECTLESVVAPCQTERVMVLCCRT